MCNFLQELKGCSFMEKCGRLDDEITLTKKDLLLAAIATTMTGVVVGMLTAMKHRPPMPPEGKKKHCFFRKRFF